MIKDFSKALIENGLISQENLTKIKNSPTGEVNLVYRLLDSGQIDEEGFTSFYARFCNTEILDIKNEEVDDLLLEAYDVDLLRNHYLLPLQEEEERLVVGMVDPLDYDALSELSVASGTEVVAKLVKFSEINEVLDKKFGVYTSVQSIVSNLEKGALTNVSIGTVEDRVFQASAQAGPVNRLLHLVISHGIKEKASDIHFEPTEKDLQCRFRVDGVMSKILSFPKSMASSIISSIKILAKMDIAEKRIPLDGGFQVRVENKIIDVRVSSFPTVEGEKIALRLLDKEGVMFKLEDLGMSSSTLDSFVPLIYKNYGIILVTGPTGSGKTTTLYSVLNRIKSIERNIVTIEDPIEYHLDLINQSQVNPKAGLTFAKGLRSFLRQDPDIMLVGEIRDSETAEISFQAAMTGHLVFSTLHTNDAASSLTRLKDMGVEPYLISSSIIGVLAQRLIRKVCTYCKEPYVPDEDTLKWAGLDTSGVYYHGKGCEHCKGVGFRGRVGVFELMIPDQEINDQLYSESLSAETIKKKAIENGMKTFIDDGIEKAKAGITTIEEVMRVLR